MIMHRGRFLFKALIMISLVQTTATTNEINSQIQTQRSCVGRGSCQGVIVTVGPARF